MVKRIPIIKENSLLTNEGELDFSVLVQFLFRNKKFIAFISLLFFAGGYLFSYTFKKVWQGQFQIVVSDSKRRTSDLFDPRIQSLVGGTSSKNDLQTQIGILKSPSVLMPIFEYVSEQKKLLDNKSKINFSSWKKNLKIDLQRNTSILDVEYRDTENNLILPVLTKYLIHTKNIQVKMRKALILKTYLKIKSLF